MESVGRAKRGSGSKCISATSSPSTLEKLTPRRTISTAVVRHSRYLMCGWKMPLLGVTSPTLRMVSPSPSK